MGFDEPVEPPARAMPEKYQRRILWIFLGIIILVIALSVSGQAVWFWLNIAEFGELFLRPFYFAVYGGLILATIALVRVDVVNRRSIAWWAIRLLIRLAKAKRIEDVPANYIDFKAFRMKPLNFVLWQATKVVLLFWLFRNILFGIAVFSAAQGWDSGLASVLGIFRLPFFTPPFDGSYAGENVLPMIPSLTLLLTPLLAAISARLILLVGLTQIIRVLTPSVAELGGEPRQLIWRVGVIESLIGLALIWTTINAFFPSYIDYNSKVAIGGLAAAGIFFVTTGFMDASRRGIVTQIARRRLASRVIALLVIILVASSTIAIQNNIADARKVEYRGPYTTQQIAVNRYLAELDMVREVPYDFSLAPLASDKIDGYIEDNSRLLEKIRLWDSPAAFAKIKPEIGLVPFVDFQDSDILRFNNTLYWSASLKPVLPETVLPEDQWFSEHLVYTHAPNAFLLLDGHEGKIVETANFFDQRRIYYGEGGLLSDVWAAIPLARTVSDEITGYFYNSTGGVEVPPPLSWLFEFNFFLAFRDQDVQVLRFRDVYERMDLVFPYFQYVFDGKRVDMWPVTDGENSYHLMPLIVTLDANHVPWSDDNLFRRLVGYALIDILSGELRIFVIGNDFFSELLKLTYPDFVETELPSWLEKQTRYPEELFEWRQSMYNFYHVTDPATFIVGKEFFEVPAGLDTYYIVAQPPGFEEPEFIGLLSAELRGSQGRNLAGYMVVKNDLEHLGELTFYEVSLESQTKLLGPSAVVEALERNPDFATLRTLLRSPRLGDNILYRVADHDVYFIPIYTAGAGGVVTELGAIAAVGATFTGEYYVGLESGVAKTSKGAFRSFLLKLSGLLPESPGPPTAVPPSVPTQPSQPAEQPLQERPTERPLQPRTQRLIEIFEARGITTATPTALSPDVTFLEGEATYISEEQFDTAANLVNAFIDRWGSGRILMWETDSAVNFGV
ncbi:MAG: UPF0182 family protein, partial [Candidatus Bathyarchaeia archaeon]